jgi:4-amino-4-deoxy-L-arabinose transferase-like glycosyltransferase
MLKKILHKEDTPFWLLTFSLVIFLTLPRLIQDGMFMDGMLYGSVSHNLSLGIGTFWFPVFGESWPTPFFLEQPPLVFGIQSLFFRILGNSIYVERIYIFLTMCITAYLIYFSWKIIYRHDHEQKKIGWLPVLIWITIPSCSWSYSNNMMENSLSLFSLAAVVTVYQALESSEKRPLLLLFSGMLVFLATFSKGVPGLFPISVPFLHWLVFRKRSFRFISISTIVIVFVPVIIYLLLLTFPESRESLKYYVTQRLIGRIHSDPTVGSRFYIISRLIQEIIPLIIVVSVSLLLTRYSELKFKRSTDIKKSAFFLSVGLAASVPLISTLVQRGFYLVPSFPYYALGFSILLAPGILLLKNKILSSLNARKIFIVMSIVSLLLGIGVTAMQKGKVSRDGEILHDVYAIGRVVPEYSKISAPREITGSFILPCYFMRYFNITLFTEEPQEYCMTVKTTDLSDKDYEKLNIETVLYNVYKRK